MNQRLENLRQQMAEKGIDSIFVSQLDNIRYLSGFYGSAGFALITHSRALLATDFRYTEQAKKQAPDWEVIRTKGEMTDWLPGPLADMAVKKLAFETRNLSHADYRFLTQAVEKARDGIQLSSTESVVENLRAVKEPGELELQLKAIDLADRAFHHLLEIIRPGITEKHLAWELERFLREGGSETLPFEPIVASGPNACLPHARPSERVLRPGEPLLLDFGARVDGYTSDLSRTVFLGKPDKLYTKIYDITLAAQEVTLSTLEAGMTGEQVDRLGREVIEKAGYGETFGHGLGHGVGLATHEEPRIGPKSTNILKEGMVFTIEPGIYITEWGGVRIEDIAIIEKGRAKVLSRAKKVDHIA